MPTILLITEINAPVERCFDLSRSIDLHTLSTFRTGEEAIAGGTPPGRTRGLINLGETVTWRARHFGIRQTLTSRITEYRYPTGFCDEMVKGAFKSIRHEHRFAKEGDTTLMTDVFAFESPLGWLGHLFNYLVLTSYMKRFLLERNQMIKNFAESNQWQEILREA
ncbi:MAG: SRPBCC family protein [Ferruginibacter sp.]|nr:SRPBCC family protein [Cytophagales bacterium]